MHAVTIRNICKVRSVEHPSREASLLRRGSFPVHHDLPCDDFLTCSKASKSFCYTPSVPCHMASPDGVQHSLAKRGFRQAAGLLRVLAHKTLHIACHIALQPHAQLPGHLRHTRLFRHTQIANIMTCTSGHAC